MKDLVGQGFEQAMIGRNSMAMVRRGNKAKAWRPVPVVNAPQVWLVPAAGVSGVQGHKAGCSQLQESPSPQLLLKQRDCKRLKVP